MKSKKRHHASSDDSQESNVSDKSSSSSDSESEDSSESDHRYKKKKKHEDSSDSDSNSDDQKRTKKRKHKKKKKKHGKKKRRSESVITCDRFSISDGEITSNKKKKHKHKSKRTRTSTVSEDEDPAPRRLHSVVKERRASSGDGSQPSRTYYQREYRRSVSIENYDREQEVQRFYRGSSKEHKYPQDSYNYDRQRIESLRHPSEKYERYGEKFGPGGRYNNSNPEHGYRPRGYEDFKRPQYGERRPEEHYNKRQREEPYYREDPRANNRYNQYDGPKRREFGESRDFRDRRPPEPPRYRERGFVDKREKLREERFSPERNRDMRRERPSRVDKPPPSHPREPSKSPEDGVKGRMRRDGGGEREEREEREERVDRSRPRHPPEERGERKERSAAAFDDKPKERKSRFTDADANKEYSWGKTEANKEGGGGGSGDKEKPNFGLSGKLAADTNTVNGVVLKYSEPDDAKQPKRRWRFYPFKGDKALPILYIHRQSCFVLGRDKLATDIPLEHPSVSKQHAALQYRATPFTRTDGTQGRRVRPYIIDLDSANGTFVNNKRIEPRRYVELLERDVVKFGFSQREYVLLHENSKDDAQDDDQPAAAPAVATTDRVRREKRAKEEIAADGD